jgi:AAA+ ATPase superfamily predicted ATPase
MDWIDRQPELERLSRAASSQQGGLVVVWGRRRVGKTRLLLEWCRPGGLYWVADTSAAPLQLRNFAETLAGRLPGFADVDYRDWGSLLTRLGREAVTVQFRGPLVIDELPYLLAGAPELPGILQRFVDHDAKNAGLVLALAGSSQRMMQGLTLAPDAPLYGRAKELFKLEPLAAGFIQEALGPLSAPDAVRAYAVWGGIPRYWELAQPFADLRAAVDALVLDPMGVLHDEPSRLLLEETPPAIALRPVLDAIGAGAHRLSEIGGRIRQPATSLPRPLLRLQELDLVQREAPFGDPERSGKRALYKLADPFLGLWFSLVAPKRSQLAQLPRAGRLRLFDGAFPRLLAGTWEDLCRRAVPKLSERLGAAYGPAARYWSGAGPEWDIVATADGGQRLLLGEVKWTEAPPAAATLERTLQALVAQGTPAFRAKSQRRAPSVHYALFVSQRPRGKSRLPENVSLIDARDVLEVLR